MVRHYQTETDFFASLRTICRLALRNKANAKCVPTSQQSDSEMCPNVSLQQQQQQAIVSACIGACGWIYLQMSLKFNGIKSNVIISPNKPILTVPSNFGTLSPPDI